MSHWKSVFFQNELLVCVLRKTMRFLSSMFFFVCFNLNFKTAKVTNITLEQLVFFLRKTIRFPSFRFFKCFNVNLKTKKKLWTGFLQTSQINRNSTFTKLFNICWKHVTFMIFRGSQFQQLLNDFVNFAVWKNYQIIK